MAIVNRARARTVQGMDSAARVTIRYATPKDLPAVRELALLDDQGLPQGPFLIAELGGRIIAALALASGRVVANPFEFTGDAIALLELRGAQLADAA